MKSRSAQSATLPDAPHSRLQSRWQTFARIGGPEFDVGSPLATFRSGVNE
jgi:hypothetical protein